MTWPIDEYRKKVEDRIKAIADEHPTIQKIVRGDGITENDLDQLESTLNSPDLYLTESVLGQFYDGSFIKFIKEILGLIKVESPADKVKKAFETYIIENHKNYNADQLQFIRTLREVFARKKHIEERDFWAKKALKIKENYE